MSYPNFFDDTTQRLARIEHCLLRLTQEKKEPDKDRWLSINELSDYLPGKPAKATIYGWVHQRTIPHSKQGKRLAFRKSVIDQWLLDRGRKTQSEIEEEAGTYLKRKGGKNG